MPKPVILPPTAPLPRYLRDPTTERITALNAPATALWGYPLATLQQQSIYEQMRGLTPPMWSDVLGQFRQGHELRTASTILTATGAVPVVARGGLTGHGDVVVTITATGERALAYRKIYEGLALLTPREREVLTLLLAGYSSINCAAMLGISLRTASAHRGRIAVKLEYASLAEIAAALA